MTDKDLFELWLTVCWMSAGILSSQQVDSFSKSYNMKKKKVDVLTWEIGKINL